MAELRSDIDDAPAAGPPHLRYGVFAHQERAGEINANRPVPFLQGERLDRAVGSDGRGDIDQRGEAAERLDRLPDNGAGTRLVGDIDLQRAGAAAAIDDGAGGCLRLGQDDIGDGDLGPFCSKAPGMALPISPPPPVMSATRCASLPVCAISTIHVQVAARYDQLLACWTKLPSKIADFGGNGFFMSPSSTSPSAILS